MSPAAIVTESQPLILHLGFLLQKMSDHEFFAFCQLHPEWRMERTSEGDLVIMPPTGGWTGTRNFTLIGLFSRWVEADGTGLGFDSSTGFTLPNGAKRSPDLAWVTRSRWEALTAEEQEEFPPLCPDFVVELRSRSDDLATLQAKMQEYMADGAQLGFGNFQPHFGQDAADELTSVPHSLQAINAISTSPFARRLVLK